MYQCIGGKKQTGNGIQRIEAPNTIPLHEPAWTDGQTKEPTVIYKHARHLLAKQAEKKLKTTQVHMIASRFVGGDNATGVPMGQINLGKMIVF